VNLFLVVLVVVLGAFVVLALIPVVIAVLRVARRSRLAKSSPVRRDEVVVLDKRTHVVTSGNGPTSQRYYVTFQLNDGRRLELEVTGPQSGLVVAGDRGTLEWQGPRYLGFARELLR